MGLGWEGVLRRCLELISRERKLAVRAFDTLKLFKVNVDCRHFFTFHRSPV